MIASVLRWFACAAGLASCAFAQGNDAALRADCRHAAQVVRAYDQAAVRNGGHASQGSGKAEQRQLAVAQLLSCGALGGIEAAATIRSTRKFADPVLLDELVGPFRNFRDTAVVSAVMSVASDAFASVPARIFALRTMWVLQTGKFWVGYEELIPRRESPNEALITTCGRGLRVADGKPSWNVGVAPAADFESGLRTLATQLKADASQPVEVRAAASCVLYP